MARIGFILLWVGFLEAAWIASQDAQEVRWPMLAVGLLISIVGIAMTRASARAAAQHGDTQADNLRALKTSIASIVTNIGMLDDGKESMSPYDAHGKIDELFPNDLNTFVDARETIAHAYSLQAYADVMNDFAAGERYLNRVWSASVDGYVDEVKAYLARAREQFESTQKKLAALG